MVKNDESLLILGCMFMYQMLLAKIRVRIAKKLHLLNLLTFTGLPNQCFTQWQMAVFKVLILLC